MFIPSGLDGIKVAVLLLYEMVPVKGVTSFVPAVAVDPVIVKDDILIVTGFIASLKVAETTWFKGVPTAISAGMVEITSGQIPTVGMNLSFSHPVIKTTNINARVANILFVFIFHDLYGWRVLIEIFNIIFYTCII